MSRAGAREPAWLPPVYPIINVRDGSPGEADRAAALMQAVAQAGAGIVQLRAKELSSGAFLELARRLLAIAALSDCRLVINDRADIALATDAAGVHVGDKDLDPESVRRLIGPRRLLGYSTHSPEQAAATSRLPVDYVGFGPVFASPTKPGERKPRGLSVLAAACRACPHPVVAIGGLTLERAVSAWKAGAASVAIVSDLATSRDPARLLVEYLEVGARLRRRV